MKVYLLSSALILSSLLVGCASTTHVINVNPTSEVEQRDFYNSHHINVVVPEYSNKSIGSINTGIGEHADIKIGNSPSAALMEHIEHKLLELGFTPNQGDLPARQLTVTIKQLSYTTQTIALKTEATLIAEIEAEVVNEGTTYTANFKSQKVDQYGTLPDRIDVEKELNQLLGKTVSRAFYDPQLVKLLSD